MMLEIILSIIALTIIGVLIYLMFKKACWKCIYGGMAPSDPYSKNIMCVHDGCVKRPNHSCSKFINKLR